MKAKEGSDLVYKVGFPALYFMYACILVRLHVSVCVFVFFSSGGGKGVHSVCLGHSTYLLPNFVGKDAKADTHPQ